VFVEVDRRGAAAHVALDAVDPAGQYVNEANTHLTLIRPNLDRQDIDLKQTAPGRYEADFTTPESGAYHLELSQQKNGVTTFRQTRGMVVGYPDELRLGPADEELMRRVANVSGGRYNPPAAEVFDVGNRVAERVTPLWPYLLAAALGVFLFDVALRRIDFTLWRRGPARAPRSARAAEPLAPVGAS
jgi:hypothetical protein